jgi:hypothetical protein
MINPAGSFAVCGYKPRCDDTEVISVILWSSEDITSTGPGHPLNSQTIHSRFGVLIVFSNVGIFLASAIGVRPDHPDHFIYLKAKGQGRAQIHLVHHNSADRLSRDLHHIAHNEIL